MSDHTSQDWQDAILELLREYPNATIDVKPHGHNKLKSQEEAAPKAMPHTDLRAWQERVFPEKPLVTGNAERFKNRTKSVGSNVSVDGTTTSSDHAKNTLCDEIQRTEVVENNGPGTGIKSTTSTQYEEPDGYEWYGPKDRSALSGLPCSHVHHIPSKDYIRRREAKGQPYHGLRLTIAVTQAENLTLSNESAACLVEQRMRAGKHFRRRYDAGELSLADQLEALRKQMETPDTPCLCAQCAHRTPIQRMNDIEATGRVQKPLPRPYGAKKGVQ